MCTTCGCSGDSARRPHEHRRRRLIPVGRDLLARNTACAEANRQRWWEQGIFALNLLSSPGSGKTSLLVATLHRLLEQLPLGVIEGDQQTSLDADRIRELGVPAIQINTGKACHLDAQVVGRASTQMGLEEGSVLMIENVGNLVCPAAFDLGEARKVVLLSVTEGDDKPFKYPDMFAVADVLIINKMDLLPHVAFDVEKCVRQALHLQPHLRVITLSASTGENLQVWLDWILAERATYLASRPGAMIL